MSLSELARDWQIWVAENLLRRVPRAEIETRLVSEGVAPALAKAAVDELARSPFVEAAAPLRRDARRFAMAAERETRLFGTLRTLPRVSADDRAGIETLYASGMPAIIPDLVTRWPCFGVTPRALAERFGDVEVEITVDRDDPSYAASFRRKTARLSMRAFVERIEAQTEPADLFYLVAGNHTLEETPVRALLDEIVIPDWLDRAQVLGLAPSGASLWMGPAGTVTALHHDFTSLLYCALHGRKRWRLVPPLSRGLLDRVTAQHTTISPDELPGVPVIDVVVAPGETLFLPVGWWHHVTALDASIGLSLHGFHGDQDFGFFRPGDP